MHSSYSLRATDRVVEFPRLMAGAMGADVFQRTVETNRDFVGSGLQQVFDRPAITDKHVVAAADKPAIDPDSRNRIEAVCHKFDIFLSQQIRGNEKCRAILPVVLLNPLDLVFIRPPEKIGNLFRSTQILVNTTGHHCGQPGFFRTIAEGPVGMGKGKNRHDDGRGGRLKRVGFHKGNDFPGVAETQRGKRIRCPVIKRDPASRGFAQAANRKANPRNKSREFVPCFGAKQCFLATGTGLRPTWR